MKHRIKAAGEPCRHCQTAVIERKHPSEWTPRPRQKQWFDRWFHCPNCKANFMDGTTKHVVDQAAQNKNRARPFVYVDLDEATLQFL